MDVAGWFWWSMWMAFAALTAGPCLWIYVTTSGPHVDDGG